MPVRTETMPKQIKRQGIDRVAQAKRGLLDHYQTFFRFERNPYPFALYHGVDMNVAWDLLDLRHHDDINERMAKVNEITGKARYHRRRWVKGGRNSAKTMTAAYTFLGLMVWFENNLGFMLRHSWKNVEQTMILEFVDIARKVTDDHPEYLLRRHGEKHYRSGKGYCEITVYTGGKNSRILVLPEPDAAEPREVADALKSPAGGLGAYWIDELSEVRQIVESTLDDNLRRDVPMHAGLGTTNPFEYGTWGYDISREEEKRRAQNQSQRVLVLESSMHDNPFANKQNTEAMVKKYPPDEDPVGYRLNVLGKDVRPMQGAPVFKGHFNRRVHVNPHLRCNPMLPLYVGLDWGFHHPAAAFVQPDDKGRWNILGEIVGEEWDLRRFADEIFTYLKRHYPYHYYDPEKTPVSERRIVFWCDPAGSYQSDRGNKTVEEFEEYGIVCNWLDDSRMPETRVDIMRKMLRTLIEGRPMLQVHPRCEVAIEGFEYGLHYRVMRNGKKSPQPNKDGFFEHLFDGLGYLVFGEVGYTATNRARKRAPLQAKGPQRKVMP